MNKSYGKRKRQRLCTIAFLLCVAMLSVILLNACNAYASEPAAENADNSNSSIVEVLRVTKPIKAGDKITSAKFETVKIDINETWIGAISDPSEVVGKYPLIDLAEGDFFISKYISSKKPTEPAKKAENSAVSEDGAVYHIIVSGDMFGKLAEQYGTTTKKIEELNPNLNPNNLQLGTKVRVK